MSFHPRSFRLNCLRLPLRLRPYLSSTLALALAIGLNTGCVAQQTVPQRTGTGDSTPPASEAGDAASSIGPVKVEKFRHLRWSPETNALHSDGPAKVTYTDPVTHVDTTLSASDLDYDALNSQIKAKGRSVLTRPDGTFEGSDVEYNLKTKVGRVRNGSVVSEYFSMSGELIESRADGSYRLTNGEFTTCIHSQPDYHFHVKDLTIHPAQDLTAHNVRLYLGHFAFPPLPYIKRGLSSGGGFPFPIPGYNKEDGFNLRFHDSAIDQVNETLDYDLRVNLRRPPTGFVVFQHDLSFTPFRSSPPRILLPSLGDPLSALLELLTPPTYREYTENHYDEHSEPRTTLYATIQNQQFVYNRRRTDLNISRFPEVGVQFLNILGHLKPLNINGSARPEDDTSSQTIGIGDLARRRTPNAPALLNITAALGELIENPTKVSATRLSVRANLASQPLLLGRRLSLRFGVSEFFNIYSKGSIYNLIAPEAELDFTPTGNSVFNIGYRYLSDVGRTPFAFDRRDIRHELRLQYQVSGPWAFGIASKIDLERSRAYDGQLAIIRNLDCMQVGIVYGLRAQSFNILFNFLPPRKDRSRPMIPLRMRP